MGFFDGLVSALGGSSGLDAIAQIGGALIGAGANNDAASTVADSNLQAAQIAADSQQKARDAFKAASDAGIGYIDQGVTDYTKTVAPLLTQQAITLPQNRGLTEQQQIGEQDLLRNGQATLASSGLRGAGRAGVGALMDQDRRYIADARGANDADTLAAQRAAQGARTQATAGLGQVQVQAGGSKANTAIGAGNQIGSSLQQQGTTAAGLAQTTGQVAAQAGTANGSLYGSTLGALSGILASGNSPNAPSPLAYNSGNSTQGSNV